ncbi:tRNA pseudouridine(55) synthase TruB [Fodinisporobacter ferrooxydans]|uniref:tRNA pseudouridine synthase B n=1 Tax=Fodinisporobacter ferrooxydans TaxID=2901836 RepID=A0ABY4CFU2_9BACL|nr:tRNA pseudouridine(55) synthase TruB [Alicyclobacillaceae bacterium MYW30-H2]
MRSGIVIIHKEKGMTSHQVVGQVRRILHERKIGHSGTLDPDVTGVLPLCIGQATRLIEYIQDQDKSYRAEMTLGYSTATQDASGELVAQGSPDGITEEHVQHAFEHFQGWIWQTPPAYSALKVQGKRAYELARAGEEVHLQKRRVHIYEIKLVSFQTSNDEVKVLFDVTCSKGTYIRTICHDIGAWLGCPAHMSGLVRTRSGPFSLGEAYTLAEVQSAMNEGDIGRVIRAPRAAVAHLPVWQVSEGLEKRMRSGQSISLAPLQLHRRWPQDCLIQVVSHTDDLIAIYRIAHNEHGSDVAKPEKVFS